MDGKVILGIDPGTNRTGYGIVRSEGNTLHLVVLGDIDLHRIGDPYRKLQHIFERVCQLIDTYRPDEAALESPFFGANVQSMLKLGRAQGVAMAAALSRGLPVSEYAPRRVKQAITGRGSASKEQVASLLKSMLHMTELPSHLDATDGWPSPYATISSARSSAGSIRRRARRPSGEAARAARAGQSSFRPTPTGSRVNKKRGFRTVS